MLPIRRQIQSNLNQLALIEWHQIVALEYSQSSVKIKWPQKGLPQNTA